MDDPEEFRRALERKVRAESSHGWDRARKHWGKPLGERVDSGRTIAGLVVSSREMTGKRQVVHFHPSVEDMSMFREGDSVRLSRKDPDGPDFIDATTRLRLPLGSFMKKDNAPDSVAQVVFLNPAGGDFAADRCIQIEPPQAATSGENSTESLDPRSGSGKGGGVLFDLGHVMTVGH